jgi:acetate kinase
MERTILALNSGSSSLKFAVYKMGASEELLYSGSAEAIGGQRGNFKLSAAGKTVVNEARSLPDHSQALHAAASALREQGVGQLAAAGHRIVHGGRELCTPTRITSGTIKELRAAMPFAPLHLPVQISIIEALAERVPDLLQVACFDTAFHQSMPDVARHFALPKEMWDEGVMRYGFHGLSYEYIVSELGPQLGPRAIIAHLGNGASTVALQDGRSIDTSMGLTPTGGFMMSTRSGDLDPGVLLYLLRTGRTEGKLTRLLDHEAGLLGVSGISSDMKTLLEKRSENSAADLAIQIFCYQVRKFIGAYAAVLNGLNTLVFTGGIGERSADIRAEICAGLSYLGIEIDESANQQSNPIISSSGSEVTVRVTPTNEDLMIARYTVKVLEEQK